MKFAVEIASQRAVPVPLKTEFYLHNEVRSNLYPMMSGLAVPEVGIIILWAWGGEGGRSVTSDGTRRCDGCCGEQNESRGEELADAESWRTKWCAVRRHCFAAVRVDFQNLRNRNRRQLPFHTSPYETKITAAWSVFNAAAGCTAAARCRTTPEAPGLQPRGPQCRSPWLGRTPKGAARRSVHVRAQARGVETEEEET